MFESTDFFYLNVILLKISGLWVPIKTEKVYKYKKIFYSFNTICIAYSMVYFTISQIVALKDSHKSRATLIANLNMASSFIVTLYKVYSWFHWRGVILNIMDTLQKTCSIFDEFEDYKPELVIQRDRTFKNYLIIIFRNLAWAVPGSCIMGRILEVTFYGEKYEIYSNITGYEYTQDLPYQSWMPFNHKSSKGPHIFAVFLQCLALFSCGTITVGLDMLYTALVIFTSVHFKLLQGAFKTIRQKCARRLNLTKEYLLDPPELLAEADAEMRKYIVHLQTILKICKLLEDIYCYLILTQLGVSLIVLCTCLFLISTVPVGTTFIGNDLAYLLAIENQLALYCYTANELTQNGLQIPQALFDGDWLSTSRKYKNSMLFTMLRMMRPVYLTIGKFMPITLSTSVTIGRASYSLLAILKR